MSKFIKCFNDKDEEVILNTSFVKEFVFNDNKNSMFFTAIANESVYDIAKRDYMLSNQDDYFDNFLEFLNS